MRSFPFHWLYLMQGTSYSIGCPSMIWISIYRSIKDHTNLIDPIFNFNLNFIVDLNVVPIITMIFVVLIHISIDEGSFNFLDPLQKLMLWICISTCSWVVFRGKNSLNSFMEWEFLVFLGCLLPLGYDLDFLKSYPLGSS